jgi:serine/threonine protein kinase/tetratricopeptide (TPR) repeat protein
MILTPGTRLGSYEIVAPIGAGGMGEVYRARDLRLERDVAIKVLPEQFAKDADALLRFEREAKAVAALSHSNILSIHDIGDAQGVRFAVMELLEGQTIRQRLRQSAIPWRKAGEIGLAIAEALTVAHAKGIIHRDIKPENIFLTSDGRVKVLDFGLARVTRPGSVTTAPGLADAETQVVNTTPGIVVGTMGYMSPEQLRGEVVDGRSDIFSLGCVLYEMVAGQKAFARNTAAESISAILNEDPPELAGSGRQVPPDFDRIIAHCVEKKTDDRFQSARDLAFALRTISSTSGVFQPVVERPKPRVKQAIWIAGAAVVLLLSAILFWVWSHQSDAIRSIAVLPFANVSADPNTDYLSDGITESIINSLSPLPNLSVMSRSSVFRYKRPDVDPQAAGRDLNVQAVLVGRVTKRGDQLSVSAELVDTRTNHQIWGDQYNRKLTDVMAIQEEISQEISDKLRVRLTGEDKKRLVKRHTENAEAYGLYLKGRYQWNKQTLDGMETGINFFKQAIDKDPRYGLAYAGLADAYALLADYNVLAAKEVMPSAKTAAMKALEIDATIPEAHASLGWAKLTLDWDWAGAEKEFQRSLELNPNYATAHQWYADYLTVMGRPDEAQASMKRAQQLEPVSLPISVAMASIFYYTHQNDQAIDQCRRAIVMDPQFVGGHVVLGRANEQKGAYAEAIAELKQALQLSEGGSSELAALGHVYAQSGDRAEAEKILKELNTRSAQTYVQPIWIAVIQAALGNKEEAFSWLRKAVGDRSVWLIYLRVDPIFDSLRTDARFADLTRQVGLPK